MNSPDQMIFDFDPSRDNDVAGVAGGAFALKDVLDGVELPSFVKATGSRGVHVVVPMDGKAEFDGVREFARHIASVVVDRDAERYTLEPHKNQRRGRVLVDINRNVYAQTVVANYAVRARPGAPVSVPIEWGELREKAFRPNAFTIRNVFARLESTQDPWKDFRRRPASLKAAIQKFDRLYPIRGERQKAVNTKKDRYSHYEPSVT